MASRSVIRKAKRIKLVLLDVDGVMTNGSIIYDRAGKEIKVFNVRDGVAIRWLQAAGIEVAILSGRQSLALEKRAKELGIGRVIQSRTIKLPAFEKLLKDSRLTPEQIAYIGDDIYDISVLKRAGLSACPADAVSEVKKVVDYVCGRQGGKGAIRELAELILKAQGKWGKIIANYLKA